MIWTWLKSILNLLSQCPTSGRWAHCTPVWLMERSSRQQTRVKMGEAKASHFSDLVPDWERVGFQQSLDGRRNSSSSLDTLCSLKYLRQTSWNMARHNVLSRKYQVWCSSSMKLLAARLKVCPTVPASNKTSSSDSDHLLLLLFTGDYMRQANKYVYRQKEKMCNSRQNFNLSNSFPQNFVDETVGW